jgi:hypothetical protein
LLLVNNPNNPQGILQIPKSHDFSRTALTGIELKLCIWLVTCQKETAFGCYKRLDVRF